MAAEVSTRDRMLVWRWRLFEVPGGLARAIFRLWKDDSPPAYEDATDCTSGKYLVSLASEEGLVRKIMTSNRMHLH